MKIFAALNRSQWWLILLATIMPLLINVAGLWHDFGKDTLIAAMEGTYQKFGIPYNPWQGMLGPGCLSLAVFGLLSWVTVFITTRKFVQQISLATKYIITLTVCTLSTMIVAFGTAFMMPLIWLPQFGDYLIGLPGSTFTVELTRSFFLPAEFVILFMASTFFMPNMLKPEQSN